MQYKDCKNILLFALCFDMCFFIKTWLFSIMLIIIFYSLLISVSNSHFEQLSQRSRNDSISLDVYYKIWSNYHDWEWKNNNKKTLAKHVTWQNHPLVAKFRILKGIYCTGFCSGFLWKHELNLRGSHWSCTVKKVFLEILQISQENICVEVSF